MAKGEEECRESFLPRTELSAHYYERETTVTLYYYRIGNSFVGDGVSYELLVSENQYSDEQFEMFIFEAAEKCVRDIRTIDGEDDLFISFPEIRERVVDEIVSQHPFNRLELQSSWVCPGEPDITSDSGWEWARKGSIKKLTDYLIGRGSEA